MSEGGNIFIADDAPALAAIVDRSDIGIWQYCLIAREASWSPGFYAVLGYSPEEIECAYQVFVNQLLYHHDKPIFLSLLRAGTGASNTATVRLLTKKSGYQWFEITA